MSGPRRERGREGERGDRRRSTKIEGEVSLQLLRYDISLYSVEISPLIIA